MLDLAFYQDKRTHLQQLLKEALELPHLEASECDKLRVVDRSLMENQFRIVLVGNFQGGKSTTFNLLCGGLEISPRGNNIKTSASVVCAQHSVDSACRGKARVVWKSERQICSFLAQSVSKCCSEQDLPGSLDEWIAVLPKVREYYDSLVEKLAPPEERDSVCIAILMLMFAKSDTLVKVRTTELIEIGSLRPYACFPEKWSERWAEVSKTQQIGFTAEECLFAFVDRIECFIDSPALARTGSVIIDCPGLDASAYDSSVALDIIKKADAVWYLLGSKAITDQEVLRIKKIVSECGKSRSTFFFTVNIRDSRKLVLGETLPTTLAKLNQAAIFESPLEKKDIIPYHALLALDCEFCRRYKAGELDESTRKSILQFDETASLSIEEKLQDDVYDHLKTVGGMPRAEMKLLEVLGSDSDLEKASDQSGFEEILSRIEREIITRKAAAILVDKGSRLVVDALKSAEQSLFKDETRLLDRAKQISQEYLCAKRCIGEFRRYGERLLEIPQSDLKEILRACIKFVDSEKDQIPWLEYARRYANANFLGDKDCASNTYRQVQLDFWQHVSESVEEYLKKEYVPTFSRKLDELRMLWENLKRQNVFLDQGAVSVKFTLPRFEKININCSAKFSDSGILGNLGNAFSALVNDSGWSETRARNFADAMIRDFMGHYTQIVEDATDELGYSIGSYARDVKRAADSVFELCDSSLERLRDEGLAAVTNEQERIKSLTKEMIALRDSRFMPLRLKVEMFEKEIYKVCPHDYFTRNANDESRNRQWFQRGIKNVLTYAPSFHIGLKAVGVSSAKSGNVVRVGIDSVAEPLDGQLGIKLDKEGLRIKYYPHVPFTVETYDDRKLCYNISCKLLEALEDYFGGKHGPAESASDKLMAVLKKSTVDVIPIHLDEDSQLCKTVCRGINEYAPKLQALLKIPVAEVDAKMTEVVRKVDPEKLQLMGEYAKIGVIGLKDVDASRAFIKEKFAIGGERAESVLGLFQAIDLFHGELLKFMAACYLIVNSVIRAEIERRFGTHEEILRSHEESLSDLGTNAFKAGFFANQYSWACYQGACILKFLKTHYDRVDPSARSFFNIFGKAWKDFWSLWAWRGRTNGGDYFAVSIPLWVIDMILPWAVFVWFVPFILLSWRRLNDCGKSPWNVLLFAVPYIIHAFGWLRYNGMSWESVGELVLLISQIWFVICMMTPAIATQRKDQV